MQTGLPNSCLHATVEPRRKPGALNIVGISSGYHDSACCLLQDGHLLAAAQEERFSRVKNDKAFPRHAFRWCLDRTGLSISDIDCIAFYEDPLLKLGRQVWMAFAPGLSSERRDSISDCIVRNRPTELITRLLGYNGHIEFVEHHLSHAASAYCFSGFDEAAILTVDGVGDWATTTYGAGRGTKIDRFEEVEFPHSLGFLYSALTAYLGFEVNEGEYKVMGLAPYGRPIYVDRLRKLIEVRPDGQFRLNMKYFAYLQKESMFTEELCDLLGRPPRQPESELGTFHQDVARSIQALLEEILLDKVRYLYSKVPTDNLCFAGGVALNVVANSRCLAEGPFKRMFVQPAAGDAGGCLGCAAIAHIRLTGQRPAQTQMRDVYLGPSSSPSEVHRILSASSAKFEDFRSREKELVDHAVELLIRGQVIGWFQGRMEFGPRALGARSILADARRPEMRDRINALVKQREAFRPFAPAVLEAHASAHFALDHPSPFMLETCQVTSNLKLPAITHVDGSARIQTVEPTTNPRFAALLQRFYELTGCPVLLNTSFNMRGEPIVCTPIDAIICFVRSQLDALVIDEFILDRSGIPVLFEFQAQQRINMGGGESVDHLVYTML